MTHSLKREREREERGEGRGERREGRGERREGIRKVQKMKQLAQGVTVEQKAEL